MPLRVRLILGYSALLLLLALAAWLGLRALTRDLTTALGETAASVGRSVYTAVLRQENATRPPPRAAGDPRHVVMLRERIANGTLVTDDVRVIVDGEELQREERARHRAAHADTTGIELVRREGDGMTMLRVSGAGIEQAIPLPRAGVDAALARYTQRLGWGLLALLVAGLLLAVWLAQRVTQAASVREDRELADLGEIGRGLAHSLRNPLHALGLSLEALAAETSSSAAASALAHSGREQLQRVDQALRSFLALSAGSAATAEPVAPAELVDDVLLEASQRANGRVRLRREGAGAVLRGVPAELRVMLHTLVINALEASPDSGEVVVHVDTDGDALRIRVDDQGAGVPDEIRARLFQPHVSGKPHGAGMGLYLAQRLARSRYRGGIELAPLAPCGTRATLTLHPRQDRHG